MTDDEILDAIDRRFAGVEIRLPPTRVTPHGGQVRGATVAGGALRSASIPVVVVFVLVALGAGVLANRPSSTLPGAAATASPSAPGLAVASPSPSPPPSPSPGGSPSEEPLLILRGPEGGDTLILQHFGWGPTLCGGDGSIVALDGAAVDRAVEEAGTEEGFVEVSFAFTRDPAATARVWVGATAKSAALAYGSRILAIGGRGDSWIVLGARGWQMVPFPTPRGRTFWTLTGTIADGPC